METNGKGLRPTTDLQRLTRSRNSIIDNNDKFVYIKRFYHFMLLGNFNSQNISLNIMYGYIPSLYVNVDIVELFFLLCACLFFATTCHGSDT